MTACPAQREGDRQVQEQVGQRLQEREGRRREGTRVTWREASCGSRSPAHPGDVPPVRRVQLQEHHLLRRLLPDHEGQHEAGTQVQALQDERSLGVSRQSN